MASAFSQAESSKRILDDLGIPFEFKKGKKHGRVTWELNGKRFSVTVAKTSSDWRGEANTKAYLRRLLRAEGVAV